MENPQQPIFGTVSPNTVPPDTVPPNKVVPSTALLGDGSVWERAHDLLFQEQLRQPVVVLDAACRLNPYQLAERASLAGLSPETVLSRVGIMRAMTVYQLIEGLRRLRSLPTTTGVMVLGAHGLFADPDLEADEAAFYHARLRKALCVYQAEARSLVLVERIRRSRERHPTERLPLLHRLIQETTHCLWVHQHHSRRLPRGKDRTSLLLGH